MDDLNELDRLASLPKTLEERVTELEKELEDLKKKPKKNWLGRVVKK